MQWFLRDRWGTKELALILKLNVTGVTKKSENWNECALSLLLLWLSIQAQMFLDWALGTVIVVLKVTLQTNATERRGLPLVESLLFRWVLAVILFRGVLGARDATLWVHYLIGVLDFKKQASVMAMINYWQTADWWLLNFLSCFISHPPTYFLFYFFLEWPFPMLLVWYKICC